MNSVKPSTPNIAILIVLVTMSIFLIGGAIYLCSGLVGFPLKLVIGICCALGAICAAAFGKPFGRLTGVDSRAINFALLFAFVGSLLCFGILLCNDRVAHHNEPYTERAVVVNRERLKRQNMRRVGKRYVPTGSYHYVYKVTLAVDSDTIPFTVALSQYNRMRPGSGVKVTVRSGLAGSRKIEL